VRTGPNMAAITTNDMTTRLAPSPHRVFLYSMCGPPPVMTKGVVVLAKELSQVIIWCSNNYSTVHPRQPLNVQGLDASKADKVMAHVETKLVIGIPERPHLPFGSSA
jgi:hypothetical protein